MDRVLPIPACSGSSGRKSSESEGFPAKRILPEGCCRSMTMGRACVVEIVGGTAYGKGDEVAGSSRYIGDRSVADK